MYVCLYTARKPVSDSCLTRCILSAGVLAQCPVSLPCLPSLVDTCTMLQLPALALVLAGAQQGTCTLMQVGALGVASVGRIRTCVGTLRNGYAATIINASVVKSLSRRSSSGRYHHTSIRGGEGAGGLLRC